MKRRAFFGSFLGLPLLATPAKPKPPTELTGRVVHIHGPMSCESITIGAGGTFTIGALPGELDELTISSDVDTPGVKLSAR